MMTKTELRGVVESLIRQEMPDESDRNVSDYLTEYPEGTRWHRTADYHVAMALERIATAPCRMSVEQTATHCRCLLDDLHNYWRAGQKWKPEMARAEWLDTLRRLPARIVSTLYPAE